MEMSSAWRKLCTNEEVSLFTTLQSAQAFSWIPIKFSEAFPNATIPKELVDATTWNGTLGGWLISLIEHPISGNIYYFQHPTKTECWNEATARKTKRSLPSKRRKVDPDQKNVHSCDENNQNDACNLASSLHACLLDYFRLDNVPRLTTLQKQWIKNKNDPLTKHLEESLKKSVKGLRLLRQPPRESLFAFMCSQNTTITRLITMITHLRRNYGTKLGKIGNTEFYSIPSFLAVSKASEQDLTALGFGYRARYLIECSKTLLDKGFDFEGFTSSHEDLQEYKTKYNDLESTLGDQHLLSLRKLDRLIAHNYLTSLIGVGPKVADCVALSSCDQLDAIPVDTHIRQVAERYMPSIRNAKGMNPKLYHSIGDFFRSRFQPSAGWAHSVVFAAELPIFSKSEE